jgi:gliding motility-associated-like protein
MNTLYRVFIFVIFSLIITQTKAQTIFWTEGFGTGCDDGQLAAGINTGNGAWAVTNTGTNVALSNTWYISASENGNAVGACGTGCGTNRTLHVGNVDILGIIPPDGGARYYAGGLGNCTTNRRAESPTINCTGRTSITLRFKYMENGEGASDDATLWYYDGAIWAQLSNPAKTSTGCNPQGTWTAYSIALPASANNNASVKIGFNWTNNNNSVGTDPSFAVDDVTLEVPTVATPVVSFTASDSTICVGNCINFTGSATNGPILSWAWTFTGGTPNTANVQNPTNICYNTAGTYSVTLTATNGSGPGTLTKTGYIVVTANPNVSVSPVSTTICVGMSDTLTASGATTYSWSPATGLNTTTGATVIANPVANITYTVTGTGAGGCTASATVVVTVNAAIIPGAGTDTSMCNGASAVLHGTGGTSYSWSPATNLTCTNCQNPIANPSSTITYTVTVSNGLCTPATDAVTVTVNPIPTVIISPNPVILCPGGSDTLIASGATNYIWTPATGLNTTVGATVIASPSANITYTVTGTSLGCSNSTTVPVTLNSMNVTPATATICAGDSVALSASGGTVYSWSPATGLSSTGGANVWAFPTVSTTYYCSTTCGSNLITNGDFSLGYSGFSTGYNLCGTPGSCGSGDYIISTTAADHHAGWTCTDHTTGSGNFMILDGSTTPGTNVWCQTVTVIPGTNYTFSFWANATTNWWNLNPAGLHAYFNGVNIGAVVTPLNPICDWVSFSGNWNSGALTSVNICIIDTCIEFGGNDFAIDDISLTLANSAIFDSCTITVNNGATAEAGPNDTICNGQSTQLNASGGGTYSWSPTTNLTCNNCANPFANPSVTTTYTVTVSNGTCLPGTDTVTITVLPAINPNAGPDDTICQGGNTILNATGTGTFSWSPATGLTCTNCYNPTASPSVSTTYTVTISNGYCSASDAVNIHVDLPVTANAGSDTAFCAGSNVQLIATGGGTYSWSPTGGLSCTTCFNPIANPGTYTVYTVTVTNGVCPAATDDVAVTVKPIPTVDAGNPQTICTGDTAFLSATGTGSFVWSPATGLSCTNCQNPQATPLGTTTYTVTLTQAGCSASDAVIVTVNTAIIANAGNNVSICIGDSTQLNATGGTTYSWSPPTDLSCTNCQNPMATPASTITYTVTVGNGVCNPATDAVTVTVNPIPVASISGNTLVCPGTPLVLTASGGTTYLWSTGGTNSFINVTPLVPTVYSVTATNSGCTDVASININVYNTDAVNAWPDTSITIGSSVNIQSSGGTSWLWSPGTGLSCTDCPNPVANPEVTTTYTVAAIDSNGCASIDYVTITIEMNCGAVYIPNVFSPNGDGNNDMLFIRGNCIDYMEFVICDRWGEKVFNASNPENGWDGSFRGKPMESGVFYYTLKATLFDGTDIKRKGSITLIK